MFTGHKLPLTLAFVVVIGLAFGASCNGFFVDPVLTAIGIGPTGQSVQVGDTLQMSARGTYDQGQQPKDITGKVLWGSDHPEIATITKAGLVTGVFAPGTTTISASLDTITNTTTVKVVLTGVTAITIAPHNPGNVQPGGSQDFTCTATVTGQTPVDITAQVTWSTSDTTNTNITNGETPALFTVNSGVANESVAVKAAYTVGGTTFTDTVTINVVN